MTDGMADQKDSLLEDAHNIIRALYVTHMEEYLEKFPTLGYYIAKDMRIWLETYKGSVSIS